MSLVWLELEELSKGQSGVALTQFSSCSSSSSNWEWPFVYQPACLCCGTPKHPLRFGVVFANIRLMLHPNYFMIKRGLSMKRATITTKHKRTQNNTHG
jgi:hypothetical protein